MPPKYYAVRIGREPGIYLSWDVCKAQVDGYSGAKYKSFSSRAEAEAYIREEEASRPASDDTSLIEAYVDGSFRAEETEFSYGMVILQGGEELYFSEKVNDPDLSSMRNVAGEIKGSEAAMRYALERGADQLIIYHDYAGIAAWCTGEWKANKPGTQAYRAFYESVKDRLDIQFVKVKGHSHDHYNDLADKLAKEALGLT